MPDEHARRWANRQVSLKPDVEICRMGDILETAIPILGGLYATLVGFGVIERNHKYANQLRIFGPLVLIFGIVMLLVALGRHY